jgi:integrase
MATQSATAHSAAQHIPWNKGRLVGPKPPLKLPEIWAIRICLQLANRPRGLALFNLAIDSKLRSCDLVRLRVQDVAQGGKFACRATVMQQKTSQPVKFELTEQTREAIEAWIAQARLGPGDYLFRSRLNGSPHVSTRQCARIVKSWVSRIGLLAEQLRHPFAPPHQGDAHLQANQEPSGGTAPAGSYETGEHCALHGYRGR